MASFMSYTNNDDNNLETYTIFCLEASVNYEENLTTQKQLRSIIKQMRTFVDPEEVMACVHCISQGDLTILIARGQLGRIVMPEMQKLQQLLSIYTYGFNKEVNEDWRRKFSKIKPVCNKLDELISVIRMGQKYRVRIEEPMTINILDRSSTDLNGQFLHSQLLIDVLIQMKSNEQDKRELIELCKKENKNNKSQMKLVNEFDVEYQSLKAVWWFTLPVLFEINADSRVLRSTADNNRPFAKVAGLSDHENESEVLFMLGSIFRLNQISHKQSLGDATISIIRLTWCSDHDNDLKPLYDDMKKKYDAEETNLLSLGYLVYRLGEFDMAEKYFLRFLSELPSNKLSLSALYHNLGMVANMKSDYDMSLEWYQKSLEVLVRTRPSNYIRIGITHNSIGNVHRNKGDYHRALESYNRAVSLFKQAHDENHPIVASFYNNIGIIYYEEKKYVKALDFYEKSFAIRKKHLPTDHSDLSGSYNNIGIVHGCLGHYDLALEHYNRSLEISLKSLPDQHPVIAMIYKNIGLVYEHKDELEQALTWLQKTSTIYQALLPANHTNVVKINDDIQRVENKLKK
ncbi:unnamed protein product [Rotaria sp. Silwood2]|nr:unnamed protein product [Rotaria sp. Silwood2]